MLQSVIAQTYRVPFYISCSTTTDILKQQTQNILDKVQTEYAIKQSQQSKDTAIADVLDWHIYWHNESKTQFEHYAYLLKTYITTLSSCIALEYTWITFIDNDDQIAYKRIQTFYDLIQNAKIVPPYVYIDGKHCLPLTSQQRQIVQQKGYKKCSTKGEYFSYCYYAPALQYFLEHIDPLILKHRFCDLCLVKYIFGEDPMNALWLKPLPYIPPTVIANHDNEYIYWKRADSDQSHDNDADLHSVDYTIQRYIIDGRERTFYMEPFMVMNHTIPCIKPDAVKHAIQKEEHQAMLHMPTWLDWFLQYEKQVDIADCINGKQKEVFYQVMQKKFNSMPFIIQLHATAYEIPLAMYDFYKQMCFNIYSQADFD